MFLPHESFWIVLFLKHLFNLQFIERGSLGNYGSGDSCFYNPGDRMEASGKLSIDRQIIEKRLLRGRVHSDTQWVVSARRVLSAEEGAAGCWGAALPSLCLEHLCLGWAIPTLLAAWLLPAWLLWLSCGAGARGSGTEPSGMMAPGPFLLLKGTCEWLFLFLRVSCPPPHFSFGTVARGLGASPLAVSNVGSTVLLRQTWLQGWFLAGGFPLSCGPGGAWWVWPRALA